MLKIYDEPESLHEGACVRCMMNRNRGRYVCVCVCVSASNPASSYEDEGIHISQKFDRTIRLELPSI